MGLFDTWNWNLIALQIFIGLALYFVYFCYELQINSKLNHKEKQREKRRLNDIKAINQKLIGSKGIATTSLRPGGTVKINGKLFESKSQNSYIEKERTVVVTNVRNGVLLVEEL